MGEHSGRVLVVDDDPDLRRLVRRWLSDAGIDSDEAADGSEALAAVRERMPAVIVLDVVMPGISGYEVCRRLREEHGERLAILLLSGVKVDPLDRSAGLLLGADDFLTKPLSADELLVRVRRLSRRGDAASAISAGAGQSTASPLTAREAEVLALLARGLDGPAVADELSISAKTVSSHVQRIMAKLGVHTRAHAVARALADGFLEWHPTATPVGAVLDLTDRAVRRTGSQTRETSGVRSDQIPAAG